MAKAVLGVIGGSGIYDLPGLEKVRARKIKSPWSAAFGASFATIGVEDGGAHSENGYSAEGAYSAGGENYSEAASEVTNIESVSVGGVVNTITTTCITKVYAGGSSSAFSF